LKLRCADIEVIVVVDDLPYDTPDSIFPNNWISFHSSGEAVLYPMFAENRRKERRLDIFDILLSFNRVVSNVKDLTRYELENKFLEGTGSMVLDRPNRIAYCALSERADLQLFHKFCEDMHFAPITFVSYQTSPYDPGKKLATYHTNVMMTVASTFAIVCMESVHNTCERNALQNALIQSGTEIIEITLDQMKHFAGNMLQLKRSMPCSDDFDNQYILAMSTQAYECLRSDQIEKIEVGHRNKIVHSPLSMIETCGGGSARCMLAEVFLPKVT
jgi:hypothetical protein